MSTGNFIQGPGHPFDIPREYRTVINSTGQTVAVGEVVMFDMTGSSVTDSTEEYNDSRIEAHVIAPNTVGIVGPTGSGAPACFWFGIVVDLLEGNLSSSQTPGGDGLKIKVLVRGRVKATWIDSGTDVVVGDALFAETTLYTLTNIAPARGKVIGIAQEATAVTGDFWTIFDGINGWGHAT